nr:MAG TPA: hypothetical protein [Caudoviricetes sp.]
MKRQKTLSQTSYLYNNLTLSKSAQESVLGGLLRAL